MDHNKIKKIYLFPGEWIWQRLPDAITQPLLLRTESLYESQSVQSGKIVRQQGRDHLVSQLSLLLYGILFLFLVGIVAGILQGTSGGQGISVSRNPYGQGQKQVTLSLSKGEASTQVEIGVKEQQISRKEAKAMWRAFYKDLKQKVQGRNASLQKVNENLLLPGHLEGYPFSIKYEIGDPSLIRYDGTLAKEARKLKKGFRDTQITVTANYQGETKKKTWQIRIVPAKVQKSVFTDVIEEIKKTEKTSRKKNIFMIPEKLEEITVEEAGKSSPLGIVIFLGFCVLAGVLLRRYYALKESSRRAQDSAMEDFPLIVHLLTLYMGAGLSFSRSVHRISRDYTKGNLTGGRRRYAFEQIQVVSQQIQMGVSQKEACQQWGQRMNLDLYRKLSVMLMQCLSKGSQEVRVYLAQMEQEAFRTAIDRGKKKGEEASTKMVLPMVLLMAGVMVMVMLPALLQIQNY